MSKLTDKQELFCQEYLVDLNATQAAIRAGYSEKTANEQGSQNLAKLSISTRIAELQKGRADRLEVSQNDIIKTLLLVQDRCLQQEAVMVYDPTEKKMVESGEWKFDSSGALKATEMLAKHIGFYEKDNNQKGAFLPSQINVSILDSNNRLNGSKGE